MGIDEQIKHDQMIYSVALEVLNGGWGSDDEQKRKLEAAGWNYYEVQNMVNQIVVMMDSVPEEKDGILDAIKKKFKKMVERSDEERLKALLFWAVAFCISTVGFVIMFCLLMILRFIVT